MISVVVIDDEIDARDKMVKVINRQGFGISIVGTASNGNEAYNLICREEPVVALIDIEMAGMSGLEVIKKVREKADIATAFVIISSHSNFAYAKDAISLGVFDYQLKPFLPQELISSIYQAVKRLCAYQMQTPFELPAQSSTLFYASKVGIHYPFPQERDVVRHILAGNPKESQLALNAFFHEVRENNQPADTMHCYLSLYFEFVRLIKEKRLDIEADAIKSGRPLTDTAAFVKMLYALCHKLTSMFSKSDLSATIIQRAKQYIEEHYQERLTLNQVAQAMFVSPNYLSSLFMRHLNMHFTDCIQQIRIKKAQELIKREPQLKNYEIAERVGFCSVKYFSAVFSKVVGMNVSQYRTNRYPQAQPPESAGGRALP